MFIINGVIDALSSYRTTAEYLFEKGEGHFQKKNYQEAIKAYSDAIELYEKKHRPEQGSRPTDSTRVKYYYHRGLAKFKAGLFPEAIRDFDEVRRLDPNRAENYRALANAQYSFTKDTSNQKEKSNQKRNLKDAIKNYTDAINLGLKSVDCYMNRGNAYFTFRNYESAIKDYDQAINKSPHNDSYYHQRGKAYFALQQYLNAIKDFDSAIELNSKEVKYYIDRAKCYDALGVKGEHDSKKISDLKNTYAKRLYEAIEKDKEKEIIHYIEIMKKNGCEHPFTIDEDGKEELLVFTLVRFGCTKLVRRFLNDLPSDVDEQGNSLLHVAAKYGQQTVFKFLMEKWLLKKTGDNWPLDHIGQTPFHVAAIEGYVELIVTVLEQQDELELELRRKADNDEGNTVVHYLIKNYRIEALRTLVGIDPSIITIRNASGIDAVMQAVNIKSVKVVRELLKYCQDDFLFNQDRRGQTALHLAVLTKDVELVKCLVEEAVERGLSLDKRDHNGKTALDLALDTVADIGIPWLLENYQSVSGTTQSHTINRIAQDDRESIAEPERKAAEALTPQFSMSVDTSSSVQALSVQAISQMISKEDKGDKKESVTRP